jgi:hypothetical protein
MPTTYEEYVLQMKEYSNGGEPCEDNYFNEPPCCNMWRDLYDITPSNATEILGLFKKEDWYWYPFCGIKCHRYWCEEREELEHSRAVEQARDEYPEICSCGAYMKYSREDGIACPQCDPWAFVTELEQMEHYSEWRGEEE